jgi:hypothetical protein
MLATAKGCRSEKAPIFRLIFDYDLAACCHIFTLLFVVFFIFISSDGRRLPLVTATSFKPTLSEVLKENERSKVPWLGTDLRENEKPGKAKKRRGKNQQRPSLSAHALGQETGVVVLNNHSSSREVNTFHKYEGNGTHTIMFAARQSPLEEKSLTKQQKIHKTTPWIESFLSIHRIDALLRIPRDFLEDNFNLYNMSQLVEESLKALFDEFEGKEENNSTFRPTSSYFTTIYRTALKKILGAESEPSIFRYTGDAPQLTALLIEKAAEIIYLYAHARFVSSQRGLDLVHKMLLSGMLA